MDKKKLLLITNGFPFGNSERGFLSTEYELLEEKFDVYILVRSEMPAPEQWAAVDKSRVFCTGIPSMRVTDVLKQVFRKEVIRECLAAAKGCGIKLLLKRLSAVLRYSARADSFAEITEKICKEKEIDILYS